METDVSVRVFVADVRSSDTKLLRLLAGYHAYIIAANLISKLRNKHVMFPEVSQKPVGSVSQVTLHTRYQAQLIGRALPSCMVIRGDIMGHSEAIVCVYHKVWITDGIMTRHLQLSITVETQSHSSLFYCRN
jgi:hypothetical protein